MLDIKTRNEINRLRVHGYAVSGIAAALGLSVNTVKSYIRRHPTVDGFIICPECKTAFPRENAKRKTKKFCSDACRMAWWNKNWDKVKRSAYYNCRSPFSNSIICGDCGAFYGPKVWHSNDQYRRVIWQCNSKFKDRKGCKTPHLTEEKIHNYFLSAFSILFADRNRIIEQCQELQNLLTDTTRVDNKLKTVTDEMEIVEELVKRYVYENANTPQSQKYNDYIQRYDTLKNKRAKPLSLKESKLNQRDSLSRFMFTLMELDDLPIIFSDTLWTNTVETMTLFHDGDIVFKFKCGKEIKV